MAIVYFIVTYGFSCLLRSRLLCIRQYFNFCAGLYCRIVENHIHSEPSCYKPRASERASEGANTMVRAPTAANTEATKQKHNCRVRTPQAAKTEATKQKQHTTHDYSIYSSVAISVHCCLHWCSHRHLALVLAPYIYPAILHLCSHFSFSIAVRCLVFLCTAITRAVRCLPW